MSVLTVGDLVELLKQEDQTKAIVFEDFSEGNYSYLKKNYFLTYSEYEAQVYRSELKAPIGSVVL